jgi:hypothetical protein
MDAPNIHIISADGQSVNMANMGANSTSQLDRNPGSSNFNFAPPLYPASYNFGNVTPTTAKDEVPPKLLNNNILRAQQRGILAHTHSMDELFSIKDILNGENIDANELPITDFGNPPVIAKDGANENPTDQASAAASFQTAAKNNTPASIGGVNGPHVSTGKQETAVEDQARFDAQSKTTEHQDTSEHNGTYGLEAEDQEGSTYDDQYNKVVPKLRFKSPKRKSPSSSEEKLIEVEEQNENDKPIVHVNKKRKFNSFQYLFSPDFDDNPNQFIDVLRTKYTLPNKSNTFFEDGGRFTEVSLAIRKQRIANELANKQKDQMKQVRVKKTLKAK